MKKILLILSIFLFTGCSTMRYGNFANVSESTDNFLAADAVRRMAKIYPPAKNTFHISKKTGDGFGLKFISKLRNQGYGIVENAHQGNEVSLLYVVDEVPQERLYRVSIFVGRQSLSRAYVMNGGVLKPFTAWTYKE